MTISKERVEKVSRKTGFRSETVQKVLHLLEFLRAFVASPLSKEFALIGGTAIYLSRKEPPRLSEDIDLDYIGDPGLGIRADKLDSVKKKHVSDITELATKLRWNVRHDRGRSGERDTTLFLIAAEGPQIELNLSYRSCYFVFDPVQFQLGPLDGDPFKTQAQIKSLCKEELWASKLLACIQDKPPKKIKKFLRDPNPRVKARHVYDIYWLTKHHRGEVDLDSLRKCFILFGVSRIERFRWYRGEVIQYTKPADIRRYVLPMLRMTERVPQLPQAAGDVRQFLDQSIYGKLCSEEYEFMNAWERGAFTPSVLFPQNQYRSTANRLKRIRYYDEILGILLGGKGRRSS